jgi:hypothetical protein
MSFQGGVLKKSLKRRSKPKSRSNKKIFKSPTKKSGLQGLKVSEIWNF